MAYDIGPRIGIEGESAFRAQLLNVSQSIRTLGSEMKAVTERYRGNESGVEALTAKHNVLSQSIDRQKEKIEQLKIGVQKSAEAYGENDTKTLKWKQSLAEAEAALSRMDHELKDNEKVMDALKDTTVQIGPVLKAAGEAAVDFGSKLASALSTLTKIGAAALTASTAAIGAFAKASVDAGMEFDSSMSNVASISGAAGEDFDKLREKAIEMGAKTAFSAKESADAMSYMAMAGWKTGDMLNGIEGVMNLAAASGEDLATTADIVTDALTAFGMSASESGHFADILAAASSSANTNVSMMGETFKYVAPIAGALKISAESAAEAIGLMANAGIKSTQAGTALRSVFTRLSTNAGETKSQMGALTVLTKELGVEFYNADGTVRNFNDVMDEARAAWRNLGAEQQTEYAKLIAGTEAMSGWLAIMNAAPADVEKVRGAIAHCSDEMDGFHGAAEQMANVRLDNLAGDLTILDSALGTLKQRISDELSPVLREFVQFATRGVTEITEAFQNGGLSAAIAALGPLLQEALTRVVELIPAAVQAGGQLLSAVADALLKALPSIVSVLIRTAADLLSKLAQNLPQIAQTALSILSQFADSLKKNGPVLIAAGGQLLMTLGKGVLSGLSTLKDTALTLMSSLGAYLKENLPALLESSLTVLKGLTASLRENAGLIVDGAISLALALAQGLADSIPIIIENLPEIVSNIANVINDNAPKILAAGVQIVLTLIKGILQSVPVLLANIPQIIGAIVDVIAAFNWLNLGATIVKGIGSGVASLKEEIPKALKSIAEKAGEAFKGFNFKGLASWAVNNIAAGFKSLVGNAAQWGRDLISNFVKGITSHIKEVVAAVLNIGNAVADRIGFSEPKEGPLSDFHTYAPDMMELYAQGIRENAYKVRNSLDDALRYGTPASGENAIETISGASGGGYGAASGIGADALKDALAGMGVYMDGQRVGRLIRRDNWNASRACGALT